MLSGRSKSLPFLRLSCSIYKVRNLYQSLPVLPPNRNLSCGQDRAPQQVLSRPLSMIEPGSITKSFAPPKSLGFWKPPTDQSLPFLSPLPLPATLLARRAMRSP